MARTTLQLGLAAFWAIVTWSSATAQYPVAMPAGQKFAAIEAKYAESADASKTNGGVQQVAYGETSAPLPTPTPTMEGPTVIPPASSVLYVQRITY